MKSTFSPHSGHEMIQTHISLSGDNKTAIVVVWERTQCLSVFKLNPFYHLLENSSARK